MARKDHTDAEILALIADEEAKSYGINDAALAADRAKALTYYNGEVDTAAPEGRSNVVSRDVLDVVESALPQLLKIFVSGDEVVRFEPKGYEDEQAAQQETDYVNHVVMEKNNGFHTFYTWFKDAMLSKNGYVKVWYEEEDEVDSESYQGLTDAQIAMLLQDERIEVVEHTAYPDPTVMQAMQDANAAQMIQAGAPLAPPMLHDVKIEVSETRGCIKICNVAPEDILVSTDCRTVSVANARFVQHRSYMTREKIEEQGWNVPDDLGYTEDQSRWDEQLARDLYDEDANNRPDTDILVKDTYYCIDGERKRYVSAGNVIVHQEDAEIVPIATVTPHIMPHRHVGMSYADLCMDVQDVKTALVRGQLDNQYLANNGRTAISDKVNIGDLLTNRPGGVVRVQGLPSAEIMQLQHLPSPPSTFSMIEYMDSVKEKRTGITAYNQGMDADTLNKTASGISQIMSAAQQRIELVARTFAETGVKELFMLVHRLVRKYYTKPDIIRLRNEWVEVDPRQWKTRSDMSISVGLGTGNKDQQLMHLQTILMAQKEAIPLGIATPKNIYNALAKLTMNAGFKNAEEFWTDPDMAGPQPPKKDPLVQAEEVKAQAEAQKVQFEAQHKERLAQVETQADIQKFQAQAELDQRQAEQSAMLEQQRSQNDMQIEREKMALEAELKRYEIDKKAEVELQVAMFQANLEAQRQERESMQKAEDADRQMAMHREKIDAMTRPKRIVKGADGRAEGIE